ncbi:unnamed protein product, partial [Amoebophrya sp. A25]|eukprot:GSA25T00019917001.1
MRKGGSSTSKASGAPDSTSSRCRTAGGVHNSTSRREQVRSAGNMRYFNHSSQSKSLASAMERLVAAAEVSQECNSRSSNKRASSPKLVRFPARKKSRSIDQVADRRRVEVAGRPQPLPSSCASSSLFASEVERERKTDSRCLSPQGPRRVRDREQADLSVGKLNDLKVLDQAFLTGGGHQKSGNVDEVEMPKNASKKRNQRDLASSF